MLYIPNFAFNLFPVAKLVDNLSSVITFGSSGCHTENNNSLKIIDSTEMQDRLYILRVPFYQKLQIKLIKSSHITNNVNFTTSDLESF